MPDILRYLGLAEEPTFAPAEPPAAAFHVDIASATLDSPTDTEMIFQGGLGRGARTRRPGFYAPAGNLVYAIDVRTVGWILRWALAGYVFTDGSPGLNTHEIHASNTNTLPSFTARVGKDVFEHVFAGCSINSLQLAIEGEFIQATMEVLAARDARASIQARADLALPEEFPLAFHEMTATLAGTDRSADIKSFTLVINHNLNAEAGRSVGSRHPRRLVANAREITFSANLWFQNTDEKTRFWGDADGPVAAGATEFALVSTFNAGDDGQLVIRLPRVIYNQVQLQPSGKDEMVQAVAGRALEDEITLADEETTVLSEILATLTNAEGNMAA